mgnify:CR=1 FL=1
MTHLATLLWLAAYWVLFVPASLLLRPIFGRPMALRPDPGAETYWVPRTSGFSAMDKQS